MQNTSNSNFGVITVGVRMSFTDSNFRLNCNLILKRLAKLHALKIFHRFEFNLVQFSVGFSMLIPYRAIVVSEETKIQLNLHAETTEGTIFSLFFFCWL
jgi:hypothetical protein